MQNQLEIKTERGKGIVSILCAAFFFALMSAFVRLAGELPSVQKSFFRNVVALLFSFCILCRDKERVQLQKPILGLLLLRSVFGTIGILGNFYATDHLLLSDASMLNKLSPFFAILFSFFLLKEKMRPFQMFAVLLAFIGSLFIIKPSGQGLLSAGALAGILGGLCAGLAYTYVRMLGKHGVKGSFIVFFFSAVSCLITFPFLLFDYHPMTWVQIGYLLLAGVAAAGGQFSVTAAYAHAPARELSVFDYTQVIFSAILGFLLFGQAPDRFSILGYGMVCGASIFMVFYQKRREG